MLNLKPKNRNRQPEADRSRMEALERLYAHYVAVDDAIRALEKYREHRSSRALESFTACQRCA